MKLKNNIGIKKNLYVNKKQWKKKYNHVDGKNLQFILIKSDTFCLLIGVKFRPLAFKVVIDIV